MQKCLCVLLFAFVTTSLSAQINFTITGRIVADTTKKISIEYDHRTSVIPVLTNGTFSFSGKANAPCTATMIFGENEYEEIWLDNGKIEMTVEKLLASDTSSIRAFKITSVKGPEISESYFKINKVKSTLFKEADDITDPLVRNRPAYKRLFSMIDHFVTNHPSSNLSIDLIRLSGLSFKEKELLFSKLDKSSNTDDIEFLSVEIEREKKLAPGNTIDDFSMTKHDGTDFQLSQLQSKYIMLEFWSSWCGPCRAMRPGLTELYRKYHNKGLEIVGISFDEKRIDWIKAIEKDNVMWIEVSDLKGFKTSIATKYKINAIPFWILIDKNRKVIKSGFWSVSEQILQKLMP